MENNKMFLSVSIWRACFSLLPGILFYTGFAYILWQIVETEKRDVFFYGGILFFLFFSIMALLALLHGIFGKPPVVINEEYILVRYLFRKDKKIEWKHIRCISCERIKGYHWSIDVVVLYLYPTNVSSCEQPQEYYQIQNVEALNSYLSSVNFYPKDRKLIRVQLPNARMLKGGVKEVKKQLEMHLHAYHSKQRAKYGSIYDSVYDLTYGKHFVFIV